MNSRSTAARKMPETPEPIELWDRKTVLEFFGGAAIPVSTLYRGISSGFYPKPINTSGNTVRWLASECRATLQRMIAARDEPHKRPEYGVRPRGRRRREAAAKAATLTNEPSCTHEG